MFSFFSKNNFDFTIPRNRSVRHTCVCGHFRLDIKNRIFQVTDKENDLIFPKYYYKCPACNSFSSYIIRFPADMYEDNFQYLVIDSLKRQLASARCDWIKARAGNDLGPDAIIVDLGAGEGAFCHALADVFPQSKVYAVEADNRIGAKFYGKTDRVTFIPALIETYLKRHDRPEADLIILTDVLEHLIWPERVLDHIARLLSPGGFLYMTTPNAQTFDHVSPFPRPVAQSDVDWRDAARTRQHIFMMTPDILRRLAEARLTVVAESDAFETAIRRDAVYTTILARKSR